MNYAALALVVFSLATPAFADEVKQATKVSDSLFVAGSGVNFRATASPAGTVLFRMPYGTRVEAVRHDGKFTEVTLVDAPEVRGFIGRQLVQGLRGPTPKERTLMNTLLAPKACPLPAFTPNCDIGGFHPEEYFSALAARCRNKGGSKCEAAFERKRAQQRTDALERVAFFWPDKLTAALQIELLHVLGAVFRPGATSSASVESPAGAPYAKLPRQVLQRHALLRVFDAHIHASSTRGPEGNRPEDADVAKPGVDVNEWVPSASACFDMPAPQPSQFSGRAHELEIDVAGAAGRHFADMKERIRAFARRNGGKVPWTVAAAPLCGVRDCESASRLASTDAHASLVLEAKAKEPVPSLARLALFAEPNVNFVDAKGALVAGEGGILLFGRAIEGVRANPRRAPFARPLAAVAKPAKADGGKVPAMPGDDPCRNLTATAFDVDGDEIVDVVLLRQEILESEERYRTAVLVNDGRSWTVRYFFAKTINDI